MSEVSKDDLLLQECYIDLCNDFIDRLPDWVVAQPKRTPTELIARDERILTKLKNIVPQFSNTESLGYELLTMVGHMNTKDGGISLCQLILESHTDGPINQIISGPLARRLAEKEKTLSLLTGNFAVARQDYTSTPEKRQDDSDFDQSAPMPL